MPRLLPPPPQIFHVNWFRRGPGGGEFLRPGYSENMRMLKWIVDRAHGSAVGRETPIGWMPRYEDLEWKGLPFTKEQFEELQAFDRKRSRDMPGIGQANAQDAFVERFGVRSRHPFMRSVFCTSLLLVVPCCLLSMVSPFRSGRPQ